MRADSESTSTRLTNGRKSQKGHLSTELCWRCGERPRFLRGLYCPPCSKKQKKDALRKFYYSPKGKAQAERKRGKPAYKVWRANYADAHKEHRNERERLARKRRWDTPEIVRCHSVLCNGTWILTPKNGNRRLCDSCRSLNDDYMSQKCTHKRRTMRLKAA
jgi:hypothetical protein